MPTRIFAFYNRTCLISAMMSRRYTGTDTAGRGDREHRERTRQSRVGEQREGRAGEESDGGKGQFGPACLQTAIPERAERAGGDGGEVQGIACERSAERDQRSLRETATAAGQTASREDSGSSQHQRSGVRRGFHVLRHLTESTSGTDFAPLPLLLILKQFAVECLLFSSNECYPSTCL